MYTGSDEVTVVVTISADVYDEVYTGVSIDDFTLWYTHSTTKYRGTVFSNTLVNGVGTITFKFPTTVAGVYSYKVDLATGLREGNLVKSKRIAAGSVERVTMESPIKAYDSTEVGGTPTEPVIDPDNLLFMLFPCTSAGVVTTEVGTSTITKIGGVNQLETADWAYLMVKQADLVYNSPVDTGLTGTFSVGMKVGSTEEFMVVNINTPFTVQSRLSSSATATGVTVRINPNVPYSNSSSYSSTYDSPSTILMPISYI